MANDLSGKIAKQVGRDVVNGASEVGSATVDAIVEGDPENPVLFYASILGKAGSAAAGAVVSTTANTAQNLISSGTEASTQLLGDLTHSIPGTGGGRSRA